MKYRFKNIGPIKNAELELGGLTVIAGANNTGKTCIARSLYAFQRYLLSMSKNRVLFPRSSFHRVLGGDIKLSKSAAGTVSGSIDVTVATKMINQIMKEASSRFSRGSFSSRRSTSLLEGVSGVFSDSDVIIPAEIDEKQNIDIFGDEILSLKRKGDLLIFSLIPSDKMKRDINEDYIGMLRSHIKAEVMRVLMGLALGSSSFPFILTAERFGISIFYKDLDFTKNRLVEALQKNADSRYEGESESQVLRRLLLLSDSSARYSQPVKDNIDYTRSLGDAVKRSSELSKVKLFNDIEKMMKGSYKHDGNDVIFVPSRPIRREKATSSNVKNRVELRLDEASSSVCGLSDMYFYLKHLTKKNQLMIVDEPESHLDTANQIRLARMLARCVNAGLRVLITTHSDYIVKEFNNLIMLSYPFPEKAKFLKDRGKGYSSKEFLQKGSVRAYLCEKGGLSPCVIDDRGMDIALFDNTIDNISRVSDELDSYLPDEE